MCRCLLRLTIVGSIWSLLLSVVSIRADTVSFLPVADTSLLEVAPDNNLGGADFFNVGTANNARRNRGLVLFDLSAIPSGSVINSATLTLDIVREPASDPATSFISLRQMLVSWGEGVQVPEDPASPGLGGPAAPGEATWNERFAGGILWSSPGGQAGVDFSTTASSLAHVGGLGEQVIFESSSGLIVDIQQWVNDPASNFGWMLLSESEGTLKTARGFASIGSGFGPLLLVDFTPVPEPSTLVLGGVCIGVMLALRRRKKRLRP